MRERKRAKKSIKGRIQEIVKRREGKEKEGKDELEFIEERESEGKRRGRQVEG